MEASSATSHIDLVRRAHGQGLDWRGGSRLAGTALLVSLVYYAGAQIGFALTFRSVPTSIFWLPNATMFAVFLLAPRRTWWAYVLAALPAHLAVQFQNGVPPPAMLLLFATNMGDAALGALGVKRFSRGEPRFDSFGNVIVFMIFAIAAPFVFSFLDAAIVVLTQWSANYWLIWQTRFRSNILTNLIWVPALVIALTRGRAWLRAGPARRHLEAGLLTAAVLVVGGILFGTHLVSGPAPAVLYAPLPLFLWAAARFGTGGVSGALLGFAFLVTWNATHGGWPLASHSPSADILTLQVFLTVLAALLLLLAALWQAERQAQTTLRDREAQYRSIFDASSDGVLITDLRSTVVAANPAFCRLTGYDLDRLRTVHPRNLFQLEDLQPFDRHLARAGGGEAVTFKALTVRQDGGLSHVEIHGQRFSYGGAPHVLSVVRDVTTREQAYQSMERRVAERTRVLSTLLEISNTVASTLELKPLVRMVLEQLQVIVRYRGATIFTRNASGDDLAVLEHRGPLEPDQFRRARIPAGSSADLFRETPLIIDDLHGDSAIVKRFRAATPESVRALFGYARSLLIVPLTARDRTIGVLWIDSDEPNQYSVRDAQLAWALANQAAIAIENALLYDQARELAAVEERQRLARELHDSVSQSLYASAMVADVLPETWARDPEEGRRSLAGLQELTRNGLAEMRALLMELLPTALLEANLSDLLRQLAQALRARISAPIHVEVQGRTVLPSDVHLTFYRVAQEALNNTMKHASATSVTVQLDGSDDSAVLSVRDDGIGFEPDRVGPGHMGIRIMRERTSTVGASLNVDSTPGRGTTVTVRWADPRKAPAPPPPSRNR